MENSNKNNSKNTKNPDIKSVSNVFSDTVINLCDEEHTENERVALSLGFYMSWVKENIDINCYLDYLKAHSVDIWNIRTYFIR